MPAPARAGAARRAAVAAGLVAVLGVLAACSSGGTGSGGTTRTSTTPAPTAVPTDKPGGTLRIAGHTMPSGDPGWASDSASRSLLRMVSRQLYDYPASADPEKATTPQPDLASGPPVVTDGGRTWTVRVQPAARWDVPGGGRRVTATDVARGIKRLCAPPDPSPMRGYFAATVEGYASYCAQLARTPAAQVADRVENASVPGLRVVGDDTVVFRLIAPSADFTEVLALPAASPVPAEELSSRPNSPQYLERLIADGPYHFTTAGPGENYRLSRNPSWSAGSDPIRAALADHVSIRVGMSAEAVQQALERGQADLELDTAVPAGQVASLARGSSGGLSLDGPPTVTALVVGLHGPASAALRGAVVRRALPYCVDRAAVVDALGGADVAEPTAQLLVRPMTGYEPVNPFPSFADAGDPGRCRARLDRAGAAAPKTLVLLAPATPQATAVAASLVKAFARAGVTLAVTTVPPADYARVSTSSAGHQSWDLALTTIAPDWYGNAGRTVFQPLLNGRWIGPRPPDGGYRSSTVDGMLGAALAETDADRADTRWAALDEKLAVDVVAVPLAQQVTPRFHGPNVRGVVIVPTLGNADPTNVSLEVT